MTPARRRGRGVALGFAALLGAATLLAPGAHADTRDDAQKAIDTLAADISSGKADRGLNGEGLGAKDGDLDKTGDGYEQEFEGGTIYWSEKTGATVLYGAIDDEYDELDGPDGDTKLGFPTSSEKDGPFPPTSRMATFEGVGSPVIYWTPEGGAWLVRGPFAEASQKLGAELGAPTGAMSASGPRVSQTFAAGTLTFDASSRQWSSTPAELAAGLSGITGPTTADLDLPGLQGLDYVSESGRVAEPQGSAVFTESGPSEVAPASPIASVPAPVEAEGEGISAWWWLLLLLIPLVAGIWWLINRGSAAGSARPAHTAGAAGGPDLRGASSETGAAATVPVPVGAHLPLADVNEVPEGYPVKGDSDSGTYLTPEHPDYQVTTATIWFANQAAAKAAGFAKRD